MSVNQWEGKIWDGIFEDFDQTKGEGDVFQGSVWLEKQINHAQLAIDQTLSEETISKLAITAEYALPVIAAAIANPKKKLRILDFGGGLGSSFLPLKAMLPVNQPLDFFVVENETMCEEGKILFKNEEQLTFIDHLPAGKEFDIIHAGSSFHYVDDWIGQLQQFVKMSPQYIIFADLPAGDIKTFVTIQNYYGRKVPVRFWNIGEFIAAMENLGYELAMRSRNSSNYINSMDNFDPEHRLNYFSQLIFKRY